MKRNLNKILVLCLAALLQNCTTNYTPKPNAYPRVIYPIKTYENTQTECPFEFEKPVYSEMEPYSREAQPCWYDLKYLPFDATLHLSYIPISSEKELDSLAEDAYKMVFKPHVQRAEEIIEKEITDSSRGIYGMIYDLEGRTATPFNFYLTDRKHHFIRGSFYFNQKTDLDSVMPIYAFLNKDILKAITTFHFKK